MKILDTTVTDMRRVTLRVDPEDPDREIFTVGGRNFAPNQIELEYYRAGSAPWRFLSADVTGLQVKAGGALSVRGTTRSYTMTDAPPWLREHISVNAPAN